MNGAAAPPDAALPDTATLAHVLATLETVILGKPRQIRLCLACLLARGHLLIADVPGVGKTTLAHALAHVLGLVWQRVQFTSDLLPADIIGVSVFDRASQKFHFRRGPIFTQLLLADEVNRASPRAQSALLEAMEERQVSADGTTYLLPEPFFVVATQNPHEQLGTFGLPESQLDRFLMRVVLGYPDAAHERELLRGGERRELLPAITPVLSAAAVLAGGVAWYSVLGGLLPVPALALLRAAEARDAEAVCYAIRVHPFSLGIPGETIEARVLQDADVERAGDVHEGRDHVVREVRVRQLAAVVDHLLEQRLAQAEQGAALDLQLAEAGIDDAAGEAGGVKAQDLDLARLRIDLDLAGGGGVVPVD